MRLFKRNGENSAFPPNTDAAKILSDLLESATKVSSPLSLQQELDTAEAKLVKMMSEYNNLDDTDFAKIGKTLNKEVQAKRMYTLKIFYESNILDLERKIVSLKEKREGKYNIV